MNLHNKDINWEKDAPHIASAGRANPFLVPEGYFSTLEENLTSRIVIEEIGNDKGLSVPHGYFEQLPGLIEAKIAVEELKEELSTEGFKVPEGYFETLGERIVQRTQTQKVIQVRKLSAWLSYAAAACVTAIIGAAIFLNANNNSINQRISEVPAGAIENYLNLYTDQTDMQVIEENTDSKRVFSGITNNISEKELEEYIEETTL